MKRDSDEEMKRDGDRDEERWMTEEKNQKIKRK